MRLKTLLARTLCWGVLALCSLLGSVARIHAGAIPASINSFPCADGQILKRAAGQWTCSADSGAGGGSEPSDGDKTDITVTGTGTTWIIDNDAITNAKLNNVATATIKGRTTAGTGDPEDLTVTQAATLLNAQLATDAELAALVPATATALAANPTDCTANQYANAIAANGNLTCGAIADADVPNTITVDLATAATTATTATTAGALTTNPTDCSATQFATTIAANGNLTCAALTDADVPNTITVDLASAATALAANPTDCTANQFANAIGANGNLTCGSIADADVPNNITVTLAATATALAANGANCSAGNAPLGVDASGAVETCFDVATQTELNAFVPATATALAANGTNASAGNAILGVDASGNAEGAFDVATQAELNVFVPATATALAANGANCSAGNAPLGVDASGAVESCFAVQTSDADLTTLAGKTIVGTGTDVRLSTGAFTTNDCVKVDASGNLSSAGAACGTSSVADGDKGDITASVTGTVWTIDNDVITPAKMANVATATLRGRITAGTGDPEDLTGTQATTLLNVFNDTLKGLAPSSGGGTTNFLRADGTWGVPPGTAGALADGDKGDITVSGTGATWVVDSGAISAPEIVFTPTGNIAAINVGTALAELDTEKQVADADLTTLAGKTIVGTGTDVRLSTGSFATNDCVKADANGNLTSAGAACGTTASGDFSSNTASSVDSEILLFSGTAGKTGKRATTTGVVKATSGVIGASTATDMSAPNFCSDAGSTDTYACTLSPALASYVTGAHYWFKANTINTGAATINLNALGAKTIKKLAGAITTDLADSDIRAGQMVHLIYDGTNMQMMSQTGNVPGGIAPIAAADCANTALLTLQTCIQDGDPALFYYCSLPAGCAAGEAFQLPPIDTDTVGALNLQEAWQGGKQIIGVDSLANGLVLCVDLSSPADGDCADVEDQSMTFYCDVSTGCQMVTKPDGNTNYRAPVGFDVNLMIGTTTYVKLNHLTSKLEFLNAAQPYKSVELSGYEFGACTYNEAVLVAGRPKVATFTCTDVDTDGFHFDFLTPANWNGGTLIVRLSAVSVNAAPTGNLVMSCSGQAQGDGEVITATATTGEQTVTLGFATQYKEEQANSTFITLTGTTLTAGDHVYMHCDVDAAGTTATMTDVRINAHPKVFYTVTSTSE